MNRKPDFIALLKYRTFEENGRETPAYSGYRPQVKFSFSAFQTSGQQKFIDKEVVYPGDIVEAEITIISVEYFKHSLECGTAFEFLEGQHIIGTGKIIKILNKELQKTL